MFFKLIELRNLCGLVILVFVFCTNASGNEICGGSKELDKIGGIWVKKSFDEALKNARSWSVANNSVDSSVASLTIDDHGIRFNLSWHEGDSPNQNCARLESTGLWARMGWSEQKWVGPYTRIGPVGTDESAYYKSVMFHGCYSSDQNERWCFVDSKILVDGKQIQADLVMDTIEGPSYGTGFIIQRPKLPLMVFVPRKGGWAIFEDDFETTEGRKPVDPIKDKPWRLLSSVQ